MDIGVGVGIIYEDDLTSKGFSGLLADDGTSFLLADDGTSILLAG